MTGLAPASLRCEYHVDPLAIGVARPRLSWTVESEARGQRQTARQVLVADTREALDRDLGTLWDSGRVETDETAAAYAGRALGSRQVCHWKVRVWDRDGRPSDWSAPAVWTMGLLDPGDWRARWIGYDAPYTALAGCPHVAGRPERPSAPGLAFRLLRALVKGLLLPVSRGPARSALLRVASMVMERRFARFAPVLVACPYLRKEFTVTAPGRATLYASARGIYELHVNGRRVGEDYFAPGWTDCGRRVYYQAYDVTPLLREGPNALGAILADGWYSGYVGFGGIRCHYPIMNSFAHYAFGAIGEWLFTTVAGIDTDGPGFRHIVIRPRPGGGLRHARARYDPVNGRIAVAWRIEAGDFVLDVTIPANTRATLFVPTRDPASLTEGGRSVRGAADIEAAAIVDGGVALEVGSGRYAFRAAAPAAS